MSTEVGLIDMHCHLDLYRDAAPVIARARRNRVGIVAVTTTPYAYEGNIERFGAQAIIGLGLHPELAGSRHADLDYFRRLLDSAALIGEIGLDGRSKYRSVWTQQIIMFEQVLASVRARRESVALSIHSPHAVRAVLERLERLVPEPQYLKILHWFTGTLYELERAVLIGCYFSVNASMLGSSTVSRVVAAMPLDRIVLETDGPATLVRGRTAEPADIVETAERLAAVMGVGYTEMVKVLTRNQEVLLAASSLSGNTQ